jgi:hypothetical protein
VGRGIKLRRRTTAYIRPSRPASLAPQDDGSADIRAAWYRTENADAERRRRLSSGFPIIPCKGMKPLTFSFVMAGLVPAMTSWFEKKDVDARHKAGHDGLSSLLKQP